MRLLHHESLQKSLVGTDSAISYVSIHSDTQGMPE